MDSARFLENSGSCITKIIPPGWWTIDFSDTLPSYCSTHLKVTNRSFVRIHTQNKGTEPKKVYKGNQKNIFGKFTGSSRPWFYKIQSCALAH